MIERMDRKPDRGLPGGDSFRFLGRFLRHPTTVGAVLPSSRFLARLVVGEADFQAEARVVEMGPGTGAFTGAIASRLPPRGRYLGIEREPEFVGILQKRWPELECVCDSVENLMALAADRGILPLDVIISGLPFASLPPSVTLSTLDAVQEGLRPGGTFTTFQYVHSYGLAAARDFRRAMCRRFGPLFQRKVVIRNVPPAFVLSWRKPDRGDTP